MKKNNLIIFIALVVLVVAAAVIWVFWGKQVKNPENGQLQSQDMIPELNKRLPNEAKVVKYDKTNNSLTFSVGADTYTGVISANTRVSKQVQDKNGATSLQVIEPEKLTKGSTVLIYPKPTKNENIDLISVQVVK